MGLEIVRLGEKGLYEYYLVEGEPYRSWIGNWVDPETGVRAGLRPTYWENVEDMIPEEEE